MKHLNNYILEKFKVNSKNLGHSTSIKRLEEISEMFFEWLNLLNDEVGFDDIYELRDCVDEGISEFADKYNLTDDELADFLHQDDEEETSVESLIQKYSKEYLDAH